MSGGSLEGLVAGAGEAPANGSAGSARDDAAPEPSSDGPQQGA